MKKSLLFISTLLCFFAAFAGSTYDVAHKPVFASQVEKGLYALAEVSYPHTELEINYHTVSNSSHSRQQNLAGFVAHAETVHDCLYLPAVNTIDIFEQVWCKQYLFHIYPSHNFW